MTDPSIKTGVTFALLVDFRSADFESMVNVVCSILGFRWIRRRILKWVCSRECSMDNTWSKMRDATTPFLRCNWTFFMWRIHDVLDVQGIISVILRVSVGGKDTVLKNRIGKDRSVSSEGELKG